MKILVKGSSNAYHFVKFMDEKEKTTFDMQKCTKFESFKVKTEELESTDEYVLITVIENFVCDSVRAMNGENKVRDGVNEALKAFLELVGATATRLPGTKFVLVEPMLRPAVDWYTEGLEEFTKA